VLGAPHKMHKILINHDLLKATLQTLRESEVREKLVVWLGRREGDDAKIEKIFVPDQESTDVSLTIDEEGVAGVIDEVKKSGCAVLAQMHTHPRMAFHSRADDELAILGHEGALSIVLPRFAQKTTVENFFDEAVAFLLTNGKWEKIPDPAFRELLTI
jgi:proteasome lid subunit RPN8/RPN11